MALSRDKKKQIIDEVSGLLSSSTMTVIARYGGTSVSSLQKLRGDAKQSDTQVRVVKNRLFKKALENNGNLPESIGDLFNGQLIYAFGQDEVAPAQVLANFAKNEAQLEFAGALTSDGRVLSADEVKDLARLPSKDQLRSQLVGTIASPATGLVRIISANITSLLTVLNARSEKI
jgi:large subunit ribosomal protein L10